MKRKSIAAQIVTLPWRHKVAAAFIFLATIVVAIGGEYALTEIKTRLPIAFAGTRSEREPWSEPAPAEKLKVGRHTLGGPQSEHLAEGESVHSEVGLLQITIAVLNSRVAGINRERRTITKAGLRGLNAQLKSVEDQRKRVNQRLAEEWLGQSNSNSTTCLAGLHPVSLTTANDMCTSEADARSPGNSLGSNVRGALARQGALTSAPLQVTQVEPESRIGAGIIVGLLLGIAYLSAAIWRFRPVIGVLGLTPILNGDILFLGRVGEARIDEDRE